MPRTYRLTRFSEVERDASGTWTVFNLVTGLAVRDGLTYEAARVAALEIGQHYAGLERAAGW